MDTRFQELRFTAFSNIGVKWLKLGLALDQYGGGMPARAEAEVGLHLHNWLEAQVLRREAESVLAPMP